MRKGRSCCGRKFLEIVDGVDLNFFGYVEEIFESLEGFPNNLYRGMASITIEPPIAIVRLVDANQAIVLVNVEGVTIGGGQ